MACDFHRHYNAMLAGGLERAGADVTMITRDHDLEFGGVPGAATAFVRETIGPDVRLRLIEGRVRSVGGWRQALAARRESRRGGNRVVHLQDSVGNDFRLLVAASPRPLRYAITIHDPVRHPGDQDRTPGTRWNRPLVRHAALTFVHAEPLREEVIELDRPRGAVVVIPHGIDPGVATPLPEEPSILFFGRISYYKGLDVLLDAMPAVWEALPEARLTVAGSGEIAPHPALEDPRVEIRSEHVPESEVGSLIQRSTCVVLPYRQASQSGVGSRVKPYSRPMVVSDAGGLPELVGDGSGLVVPSEDAGALAAAVTRLLADRALAERLGRAGAETAEREASWDAIARRTLDAYDEYIGAPS